MSVVVTGVGLVNPLGADTAAVVAAWRAGAVAARHEHPDLPGLAVARTVLPPVPGRKLAKYCSPAAALGLVAADAAARAAGLARHPGERVGVFAATSLAATGWEAVAPMVERSLDADGRLDCARLGSDGLAACNPLLSFRLLPNMPACLAAIHLGLRGPNAIFTPWEGQGAAALATGWQAVLDGDCDACLCGAADHAAEPMVALHLARCGLLAPGEMPASAAAWLVLEREDTARAAGVPILARLARVAVRAGDAGDPLAARLGRTMAAAPATALALAVLGCLPGAVRVGGVDGQELDALVEAA